MFKDHLKTEFKIDIVEYSENIREVLFKVDIDWKSCESNSFNELKNYILNEDRLYITIDFGLEDKMYFRDGENIEEFVEGIHEQIDILQEDVVCSEFRIEKVNENGMISVYDLKEFQSWLAQNSIYKLMRIFSKAFHEKNQLIFFCVDATSIISTETIFFIPSTMGNYARASLERKGKIEKILQNVNYANGREFCVLADDFAVKTVIPTEYKTIGALFQKLCNYTALISISDYVEVTQEKIRIRINGYRTVEEEIRFEDAENGDLKDTIYNIYHWIYSNDNVVDKLQLARNIISLHCKYCSVLELDEKTFSSLKANFDIYIRRNVDQYLQTKKDYTDFLLNTLEKVSEHFETYIDGFKKNIGAGITFAIGLVFTNAFTNETFENVFTRDITLITSFVLLASLLYCFINLAETVMKYGETMEKLNKLKESYSDIISENEIDDIWRNSLGLEKVKRNFIIKIAIITITWIAIVIISTIALDYLSKYRVLGCFDFFNK